MQVAARERPVGGMARVGRYIAKARVQEQLWAYLFLAPYLVHLVLFTAGPVVAALALSFFDYDLISSPKFVGAANYQRAFFDDETVHAAFRNTGYYVLFYVPITLTISLFIALALNQRIRGIVWYRAAFFIPVVTNGVATAIMWQWVYAKSGILNFLLSKIGIKAISWLGFEMALNSIIIMAVWSGLGILMMYWLAGLQGIPQHLYEAAEIDGAGWRSRLRHVTMPMLTPMVLFLSILGIIGSFQVFTSTYVITGGTGGPGTATLTLALLIYRQGFDFYYMGYASAIAYMMFVIVFIITMLQWWLQRYWVFYE